MSSAMGLFAHGEKYAGLPDCVALGVHHLYKQCGREYEPVTTANWVLDRVWEKRRVWRMMQNERGAVYMREFIHISIYSLFIPCSYNNRMLLLCANGLFKRSKYVNIHVVSKVEVCLSSLNFSYRLYYTFVSWTAR